MLAPIHSSGIQNRRAERFSSPEQLGTLRIASGSDARLRRQSETGAAKELIEQEKARLANQPNFRP